MSRLDKKYLAMEPFKIDLAQNSSVLAIGAELKSSICLIHKGRVYISKTGPNLIEPDSYRQYTQNVQNFIDIAGGNVDLLLCDAHPGYSSTLYAKSLGFPLKQVQHHYAHIAACIAENNFIQPVIGIAADGTGYGDDGAIWGCEILNSDLNGYKRMGHLKYFNLFGADAASIQTWRPAAGVMAETFGKNFQLSGIDPKKLDIAKKHILNNKSVIKTSSLGRLFDAVSFLLNLCTENQTEAQAAIALEQAATLANDNIKLDYQIEQNENGAFIMDYRKIIAQLSTGKNIDNIDKLAKGFHFAIAEMIAECAFLISQKTNINTIALSGGCFLNKILTNTISTIAGQKNLNIIKHKYLTPGDGCIAFGQAVVGAKSLEN